VDLAKTTGADSIAREFTGSIADGLYYRRQVKAAERIMAARPAPDGRRRGVIAVGVVFGALVLGGCGSLSTSTPSASHSASALVSTGVEYSGCMRSHGVPNFPDPVVSGKDLSFRVGSGTAVNLGSPAFQAAQKTCDKAVSGGGPGSGEPSAADTARMLAISHCMRAHGLSGFPDPTTTAPSNPAGYSAVLGHDGVFFAVPSTVNLQSPAAKQAEIACHFGGPVG